MRFIFLLSVFILLSTQVFAGAGSDLRKGNKAYDNEKYGEAFDYYNKAVEAGEGEKGIYNSAAALYKLQDYDGAIKAYESLEQGGQFKQDAYYNAANAYYNQGNSEEALKSLRQALMLKRDDKEALHNLQFILQQQQNQNNQQNKNDNQGDNKQQQDKQNKSDQQDKNGNNKQNEDKQQQEEKQDKSSQQDRKLGQNEAENILKMSKEHKPQMPDNAFNADGFIDKDW